MRSAVRVRVRQLSINTVNDYNNTYRLFAEYIDCDMLVDQISSNHITEFLSILSNRAGSKMLRNYRIGLSSLWTWLLLEKFVTEHIVHHLPSPNAHQRGIQPLTEEQIRCMLRFTNQSKPYRRLGKRESTHSIDPVIAQSNRTIILLLVDTGMRSSELCNLKIYDMDPDRLLLKTLGKMNKDACSHILQAPPKRSGIISPCAAKTNSMTLFSRISHA